MKYRRVIQAFQSTTWAILPAKFQEIFAFLELKSAGGSADGNVSEPEVRAFFDDDEREREPSTPPPQSIAVIPIHGVLARRMNMMTRASGGTSLASVSKALRESVASSSVKAIILDIDSPGGEVMGITELHAEILKARRTKPVTAHVSGMAASAAFPLASAAQEITATPSAMLGSVGVIGVHIDESQAMKDAGLGVTLKTAGKFKADASGLVPLSEEGEAELQRCVDAAMSNMIRDIAKGRGMSASAVRKSFGDARVVEAKLALEFGMIDKVETFDSALARAGSGKPANADGARVRAEGVAVELHSVNTDVEPAVEGDQRLEFPTLAEKLEQADACKDCDAAGLRFSEEHKKWYIKAEFRCGACFERVTTDGSAEEVGIISEAVNRMEQEDEHEHGIGFRERTKVEADTYDRDRRAAVLKS